MPIREMRAGRMGVLRENIAAGMLALTLTLMLPSASAQSMTPQTQANSSCSRSCMSALVDQLLASMVAHNPDTLPVATVYAATENSHPAALGMMTLWRSVTKAGKPDLLAIDTVAEQAYFEMQINEGSDLSVLWGRIRVADRKITELELIINRSRGDHGFSFSAEKLPANLHSWMVPPANRTKASRAELERLARASFNSADPYTVGIAPDCQFIEAGTHVIDPGLDDGSGPAMSPTKPLGCVFPPYRPNDLHARQLVIDEELGIVVVAGLIPGRVFPYPFFGHMMSAFIPDDMKEPQDIQRTWFQKKAQQGKGPLLQPAAASGETMQVFQLYSGQLQGSQINVHLEGPGIQSSWPTP